MILLKKTLGGSIIMIFAYIMGFIWIGDIALYDLILLNKFFMIVLLYAVN